MSRHLDDSDARWLAEQFGDRLVRVSSPVQDCLLDRAAPACEEALASLRNPYAIEDHPGAFHTTGWLGAYRAEHSPYAVSAESASDIARAVRFARARDLRLTIKGTGHDYLGRSCARGSLCVWTHHMRKVTVHDAFVPDGPSEEPGVPAVTVGAGTRWLEAYQVLAPHGRYVQGGGCTTVGAAGGFTQGGGFGSFSRRYGTAAGNVLQMEVVTADGEVVTANARQHPDLFWALRGGGGGTFGIVSKITFRTHRMPEAMSAVAGTIQASTAESYRHLIRELLTLVPSLADDHWGEQIRFGPDNSIELSMVAADLPEDEAASLWQPLLARVQRETGTFTSNVFVASVPFCGFWDASWWDQLAPDMIRRDDRPGQPARHYWWAANSNEISQYVNAYQSRWIPVELCDETRGQLAEVLFRASRHSSFSLHLNKALAGAAPEALARDRSTSINPVAFDAAVLLIAASQQQFAFPGVPGLEPDEDLGTAHARQVGDAMKLVRHATAASGSYVNEADYFEPGWQRSFWGSNYSRLLEIKRAYDPTNLFRVHHGVGSDEG